MEKEVYLKSMSLAKNKMADILEEIRELNKDYAESISEYKPCDIVEIITNPDMLVSQSGISITESKKRYAEVQGCYLDSNNNVRYYLLALDNEFKSKGYSDYIGINEKITRKIK